MFAFSFVDRINLLRTKLTAKLRSLPQTISYLEMTFIFFSLDTNPACMRVKSLQSCPTICNTMNCSPPGSPVHGILQARILEWIAMSSSRGSSWPRDQTLISCFYIVGGFFTHWGTWEVPLMKESFPYSFISPIIYYSIMTYYVSDIPTSPLQVPF